MGAARSRSSPPTVCSGRGGRRLVFWCPKGGLGCLKGGSVVSRGGSPPHPPSTIHSGSWGCVGRRGVVPGGLRGSPAGACPGGPAPAPPHPRPLPQGARGPDGGLTVRVGAWGRRSPRRGRAPLPPPSPSRGGRTPSIAAGALPIRAGAWGRSPRGGGWATSRAARSRDRSPRRRRAGRPRRLVGRRAPDPLTPAGRGAGRIAAGAPCRSGWGRGGAAPT